MSARWQRREFLRAALLQLGVWPLASLLGCGGDVDASDTQGDVDAYRVSPTVRGQVAALDRDRVLLESFVGGDLALVADVWQRYVRAFAPDADDVEVREALRFALSLCERPIGDDEVIAELRSAISGEFSARNVVDLNGWTFSPTELALCGLLWIADLADRAGDFDAGGAISHGEDADAGVER